MGRINQRMMEGIKIVPCSEDFSKMPITSKGMHCNKCEKEVVDFSHLPLSDAKNLLQQYQEEEGNVCGYFNPHHLEPPKNKRFRYLYFTVLSLLIAFISSCKSALKTEAIVPVKDKFTDEHFLSLLAQCRIQGIGNGGMPVDGKIKLKRDTIKTGVVIKRVIYFDYKEYALKSEYTKSLDSLVSMADTLSFPYEIRIKGHTDDIGSKEYNKKLSVQRVTAVTDYLSSKGLKDLSVVLGYGEEEPVASNTSHVGRAKNRRVEVEISYINQEIIKVADK